MNKTVITGAGATFPYPVYARWFSDFYKESGVRINYFSVGSSEGTAMLLADSVDFGATDIPLTDSELHMNGRPKFAQVPMVAGAVAIAYNLPGVASLNLDAHALSGMLLGRIRMWNDVELRKLNVGATLPSTAITVVHREDVSGTTRVLDSYLRAASPEWLSEAKGDALTRWRVGEGEHGNEGVSGHIKATVGAVGYVPLAYAQLFRLATARMRNSSGVFIEPSARAVESAMASSVEKGNLDTVDFRTTLTNSKSLTAYPIVTATWLVYPMDYTNSGRGVAVRAFIHWALSREPAGTESLGYASLPRRVSVHFDSVVSVQRK